MKTIKEYLREGAREGMARPAHLAYGYLRGTPYLAMERVIGESTMRPEKVHDAVVRMATVLQSQGIDCSAIPTREAWDAWCAGARVKGTYSAGKALAEERARTLKRQALQVVVRGDLPPGLAASQALHAARELQKIDPDREKRWHETSNTVVIHRGSDLVALGAELRQLGASVASFVDPDLGEAITAIAALGVARKRLRHLPLL